MLIFGRTIMETVFAVSFSVVCVIWTLLCVIACMPGKEKTNEKEKRGKGDSLYP